MNILEAGLHILKNNPKSIVFFPGALFVVILMFILLNIIATVIFGGVGIVFLWLIDLVFQVDLMFYWKDLMALAFIISLPYTFIWLKNYEI